MNDNDPTTSRHPETYPVDWERVATEAAEALIAGDTLDCMLENIWSTPCSALRFVGLRFTAATKRFRDACGWVAPPGWDESEGLRTKIELACKPFVNCGQTPEELEELERIGWACLRPEWGEVWRGLRTILAHVPQPPAKVAPEPDGPLGGKRWRHAGVEVDLPHGGAAIQAMTAAMNGKPGDVILENKIDGPASASGCVTRLHKNIAHLRQQTGVEWPHNRIGQSLGRLVIMPPDTPPN